MDEELFSRADRAYKRWCDRNNVLYQMPSIVLSDVSEHGIITLENVNGIIAQYRYKAKTDRLQRIR